MSEKKWQNISVDDIASVVEVLKSSRLTCGQKVHQFENSISQYLDIEHAVAVSSGTAALHSALFALDLSPGDEVIVPTLTFIATVNAIVYAGATPVFVDVNSNTLSLDPKKIEPKIGNRTRAIIAVDYAGIPCKYREIAEIAKKYSLSFISDACHSLGACYYGNKVGVLADITVFSFHPVKSITTGEGGMAVTKHNKFAEKMRRFRNHNMDADHAQREASGEWQYDVNELGFNYRLTDIQCALGISQLKNLEYFVKRRQEIADHYRLRLNELENIDCIELEQNICSSNHFHVVKLMSDSLKDNKMEIFKYLRTEDIAVNVHYKPVHLMSYYKRVFGTYPGICPVAEDMYDRILSLPVYPSMSNDDVEKITNIFTNVVSKYH